MSFEPVEIESFIRLAVAELEAMCVRLETRSPAATEPTEAEEILADLERTASMLDVQGAECFPEISVDGKKHFVRAVMESAAEAIRAALPLIRPPARIDSAALGQVLANALPNEIAEYIGLPQLERSATAVATADRAARGGAA